MTEWHRFNFSPPSAGLSGVRPPSQTCPPLIRRRPSKLQTPSNYLHTGVRPPAERSGVDLFGYDKYRLAKIKYKIKYHSLNATTVAICPKEMVKVCHGRHTNEPTSNLQTQSNLIQQLTLLRGQSQYVSVLHLFGHALNSGVGSDELDSWVPF